MGMHLREGQADLQESHEINVTPFIDVMLVLLIIFMVAAPLATVDVKIDLPDSHAAPQPRPEQPLYLSLRANHELFLGDDAITLEQLASALDQRTGNDHSQTVFVRGDKDIAYARLMEVMDALRAAGYLKIGLVGLTVGIP